MNLRGYWCLSLFWTGAAALLIDFGHIHRFHNADSLIPVLSSLHRWTPFYWEQNRYGMIVALVAAPFRDPVTNLLVQNGITTWFGLLCFPLGARYLTGGYDRPWVAPVAAATFLGLAPGHLQWMFLSTVNVFSTSLALGLVALVAVERPGAGRSALSMACMALAAWTNASVGVLLFPLALWLALARRWCPDRSAGPQRLSIRPALGQLALCPFAVAVSKVLERLPRPEFRTTWLVAPPLGEWPGLIGLTFTSFWAEQGPAVWAGFLGGCALIGGALAVHRRNWRGLVTFAAVGASAAFFVCLTGVLYKARWRYSVPDLVLIHLAAHVLLSQSLPRLSGPRGAALTAAGLVAVLAAVLTTHGSPSRGNATAGLEARHGGAARAARAAGCTHIAGDYWEVWPAVFLANARPTDGGPVWGLTFRSTPTGDLWKAVPPASVRVATFPGDPEAAKYLPLLGVPLTVDDRPGPLVVYVAR